MGKGIETNDRPTPLTAHIVRFNKGFFKKKLKPNITLFSVFIRILSLGLIGQRV
jgi:hypothetical protein